MRCWPWQDYHVFFLGWQTDKGILSHIHTSNYDCVQLAHYISCQFLRNCESIMHDFRGKVRSCEWKYQKSLNYASAANSPVPYITWLLFRTGAFCSKRGGASCRLRERACKKFVQNLLFVLKVCAFFFFIGAQKKYSFIRISSVFISTAFAGVFVVGVYRNVHQLNLTCCNPTKTNYTLVLYGQKQRKVSHHFFGTYNLCQVIYSIWSFTTVEWDFYLLDFLDAVGFPKKSALSMSECF